MRGHRSRRCCQAINEVAFVLGCVTDENVMSIRLAWCDWGLCQRGDAICQLSNSAVHFLHLLIVGFLALLLIATVRVALSFLSPADALL